MLVLTRKVDEAVKVGDDCEVVVLSIHGREVRLGFRAPGTVKIVRTEVLEREDAPAPPLKMAC